MSGCRQLDSRLVVPPLPPRHIWRPRLITALDGADVPLTLLATGPGADKSHTHATSCQSAPRHRWTRLRDSRDTRDSGDSRGHRYSASADSRSRKPHL